MNHSSKYHVPNFQLHELVERDLGQSLRSAPNNSYYTPCPIHNHSTPGAGGALRIYAQEDGPGHGGFVCPRGWSGNVWDFIDEVMGLPGPDDPRFDETVLHICNVLDVEPQLKTDYEPTVSDQAQRLMIDLRESLSRISFDKSNAHYYQSERGQWLYRGIPPMTWLQYDVGMIKPQQRKEVLSSYSEDAKRAAGLNGWGKENHRRFLSWGVVIFQNSENGAPLGFAVRLYPEIIGSSIDAKYAKTSSDSQILDHQTYLFGVDGLQRDDSPELFVVEGEFDQLSLRVRGMPNVVTFGSGQPTDNQVARLQRMDRHTVFIADSDANEAGFKHMSHTAHKMPRAEFVFLPGEDTDPDEFVRKQGINELKQLPRYSALQVYMIAEDAYDWQKQHWTEHTTALTEKYMQWIVQSPTAQDEQNISLLAELSGQDESYLKSWLFYARNQSCISDQPQKMTT